MNERSVCSTCAALSASSAMTASPILSQSLQEQASGPFLSISSSSSVNRMNPLLLALLRNALASPTKPSTCIRYRFKRKWSIWQRLRHLFVLSKASIKSSRSVVSSRILILTGISARAHRVLSFFVTWNCRRTLMSSRLMYRPSAHRAFSRSDGLSRDNFCVSTSWPTSWMMALSLLPLN